LNSLAFVLGELGVLAFISPFSCTIGDMKRGLFNVAAGVSLVLAVATVVLWVVTDEYSLACVNVGALLLLRSRSGEHITAVRLAMGATRGRIVRTALLESAMICLGGAVVGVVVLGAAGRLAKVYLPALFVRNADSLFDARVLAVALATVIASAVIAGLLPAWRLTKADVRTLLSQSPRRGGRLRGGRLVLGVESAIGCVLVLGAFFTVRSLVKLTTEDLGVTHPPRTESDLLHGTPGLRPRTR